MNRLFFYRKPKNKITIIFLAVLFLALQFPAQAQTPAKPEDKIQWHSYMQLWGNTNFSDNYSLSLRRLKFWLSSGPAFSNRWSFNVQALFTSFGNEKFFLQNVYGQYHNKTGNVLLRFGQFVPKYSLQRFQHDYLMVPLERATAINIMIPDGTLGVRDIGLQYTLFAAQKKLELNVGFFNGYGIKEYRLNNTGYLLTHNLSYTLKKGAVSWKLGYSVMYRKAADLKLRFLLPDSVHFSGNDFRCDIYARFHSKHFELQGEFLNTWLNGSRAYGYYGLLTLRPNEYNEVYLSYDKYQDLINTTANHPWFNIGYNYLFDKQYNMMLTLDTRFRKDDAGGINNITSIQFQFFFH